MALVVLLADFQIRKNRNLKCFRINFYKFIYILENIL